MSVEINDLREALAQSSQNLESEAAKEPPAVTPEADKAQEKPAPQPDELWHCRNEAWATLPNGWNHPVQSPEFRHWLVEECVRLGQGSKKTRTDALVEVYTAIALYERPESQLHLRTAPFVNGGVYIDLADRTGRAVRVTAEGWRIVPRGVRSRRCRSAGSFLKKGG